MNEKLNKITVSNEKVLTNLHFYFKRITAYNNFDFEQPVRVYCDSNFDLTAFEGLKYNIGFLVPSHKLSETIKSSVKPFDVSFTELYNHILKLK